MKKKEFEEKYMTTQKFKIMVERGEDVSEWEGAFYPWYRASERRFIEYSEMTFEEKRRADDEYEGYDNQQKEENNRMKKELDRVDEEYKKRQNKDK